MSRPDILVKSNPDQIALPEAVESRFLDLCGSWLRVRGVQLPIPESLNQDFLRWREMIARHRKADFRNTDSEWKSVKTIAQWTLDMNADLRGQQKQVLSCLEV